jgi:SAM-dependent methyltransferase
MTELPVELVQRIRTEALENDEIYRQRYHASSDLHGIHYGHAKMLDWAFEQLPNVKGARVLDVGIGEGYSAVRLALAGAQVTGIEVSTEALRHAVTLANKNGVYIDLQEMPGEALRFADASFDCILCISAYHHMDRERAASEFARVLRPGGRLVLVEPLFSNPPAWLYRKWGSLLSREATSEERPLQVSDLKVLQKNFKTVKWCGIFMFSLALFGFDRVWKSRNSLVHRLTGIAFKWVYPLDCLFLRGLPFLQRMAWKIGVVADR